MMYSRKELEEIAKVCVEQDIYVICDEIYYHLVYDGEEFVSLASISRRSRNAPCWSMVFPSPMP